MDSQERAGDGHLGRSDATHKIEFSGGQGGEPLVGASDWGVITKIAGVEQPVAIAKGA